MIIQQYDTILLKDGREGVVVEAFDNEVFIVDVGSSPKDWETIDVKYDEIERIIGKNSGGDGRGDER